jgi:hypothetical protein
MPLKEHPMSSHVLLHSMPACHDSEGVPPGPFQLIVCLMKLFRSVLQLCKLHKPTQKQGCSAQPQASSPVRSRVSVSPVAQQWCAAHPCQSQRARPLST